MTEAVKELVAAGNNALGFMDCRLNATKRFSAALLAVEAEEKPQGCPHCSCSCMDCAPCGQPPDALIPQTGGE